MAWTKIDKERDSGEFTYWGVSVWGTAPWGAVGSLWTKITKASDTWTKTIKASNIWTKIAKEVEE